MTKTLWTMLAGFMIVTSSASESFAAKRALIYKGPGACNEGCWQAAYDMAFRNGFDPTYVGPAELTSASSELDYQNLFKDVVLWVQPGGKSSIVLQTMTPQLVDAIRRFVNEGGAYVGYCAGAFSSTRIVGTTKFAGYNIFPGRTELYKKAKGAVVIKVNWNGVDRKVYWEGGPFISDLPKGNAVATAFYANGQIASAKSIYGKGKVYVTGLHPEAPQWWRDEASLKDSDGLDFDLSDEMIQWATSP